MGLKKAGVQMHTGVAYQSLSPEGLQYTQMRRSRCWWRIILWSARVKSLSIRSLKT